MFDKVISTFGLAMEGDRDSVLLLASIYVLLVCGYSVVHQLRMRQWPSTMGTLLALRSEVFGAGHIIVAEQDYVGDALYRYVIDGTAYEGKKISPWVMVASHNLKFVLNRQLKSVAVGSDGAVRVYYNPRNPRKSVLIPPGFVGVLITLGLAVAPVCFVLWA